MIIYNYKHWLMVLVYSITHFIVDFACAFLMSRSVVGTSDWYHCVLVYNFCAFAMQMPLGVLADKWNRNFLFAAIGCILVAAAYSFVNVPLLAVIIVGLGNGMFHIGGGIDILNISVEKSGALGIFVSPGAFGVYFGTILGEGSRFSAIPIILALLVATGMIFAARRAQGTAYQKNTPFSLKGGASLKILIAAVCLFLVVCLRSFVGLTLNFPWKGTGYLTIALLCAVVFGKTIGGFAADSFGALKVSCVSLSLAALFFLIPHIPAAGILSVLLFNMTMPITLWAMAKLFPGAKGFSFGLLTFGLFIGFLPVYIGIELFSDFSWFFALSALISLLLLWTGLRKVSS